MNRRDEALKAAMLVGQAIVDVVPIEGIPSGTLYAALMGKLTLENFNAILAALVASGAIVVTNHYVTRGPNWRKI